MPLQTRSRSVNSPKAKTKEEQPADAAASAEEEDSSAALLAKEPQEPSQQQKTPSQADEYQASSPKPKVSAPSSRSPEQSSRSNDIQNDRRDGESRGSSTFSPPAYKMDKYAHAAHKEQRPLHPGAAIASMDAATRRDFDQLDLNVDFMGPEDPLLMGSFLEESPPRVPAGRRSPSLERDQQLSERKRAASRGPSRSPLPHPYAYQHHPYSASRQPHGRSREGYHSTPSGRRPPPPGHPYGTYPQSSPPPDYSVDSRASPRFYGGYSPYHQYPESYWDGPPGTSYPFDQEDEIPPPPPSSTKKRPLSSDPSVSPTGTPEKALKPRSPFRSPPPSRHKLKRSPDFAAASPYFGTHNSFSFDTPIATLGGAEFSPMGPAMQEFDENAPLPFRGDSNLSRSDSQDSPVIRRRPTKDDASPLTGFMNELSPFQGLQGIARSPVVGGYDEAGHVKPVTASATRSAEPRIRSTPHGSVKKALWPRADGPISSTPGRVRLEIGSAGALSTRKSLEGINSMIHARHTGHDVNTPSRYDAYGRPRPPHMRGLPTHSSAFRGDIATPIKSSGYQPHQTPTSMHRPPYPGSASKYGPPGHHTPSASKVRYGPPPTSVPSSGGKENKKVVTPKHIPCNCKKSKCLKLYCDCFAALKYCKDCNCSDCGNIPTAGAIREQAIKAAKAKNANAFVPRFNGKVQDTSPETGHNMGCRCKRSECLKKYCECFQAGVICGDKCKCVDCLNFAGSQALIDKRRKIKDQRGADFAMRVADEAWKQGRAGAPPPRKPAAPAAAASSAPPPTPRQPSKTPPTDRMPPPHMMQPSPRGPPPPHGAPHGHSRRPSHGGPHHGGHHHAGPSHGGPQPGGPPHPGMHGHPHHPGAYGHPHHPYHGMHPYMRGPPPGYPHMGMSMTPAGYPPPHGPPPPHMLGESPHPTFAAHRGPPVSAQRMTDMARPALTSRPKPVTPAASTLRTPGIRVKFDPASSRKKRKISPGQDEATLPFFGLRFPAQPKTTALAIFAFLSNDDLFNAGLVCKSWSQLAMDDELWRFEA